MPVPPSIHYTINRLLGAPQADFMQRNQRLRELLSVTNLEFVPPGDDGGNYDLKGTASLCANLAFSTFFELRLLTEATLCGQQPLIASLEVLCRPRQLNSFPFSVASGVATAFQTRLAMHRPARKAGDEFECSTTGRASFSSFWESFLADLVMAQAKLLQEDVIWKLKKQGFVANPVMVRAGLNIAIRCLLKEQEPSGPVAEVWFECGLDGGAIKKILSKWATVGATIP